MASWVVALILAPALRVVLRTCIIILWVQEVGVKKDSQWVLFRSLKRANWARSESIATSIVEPNLPFCG